MGSSHKALDTALQEDHGLDPEYVRRCHEDGGGIRPLEARLSPLLIELSVQLPARYL